MIEGITATFEIINESLINSLGNIANFKLILPQNATMVKDELTGNYVRVPAENVIYLARVKEFKNVVQNNIVSDRRTSLELKGYLVEPLNFTDSIPFKVEAELLKNGQWLKGVFYSSLDIESEAIETLNMRLAIGDKINGYFEIQGSPLS